MSMYNFQNGLTNLYLNIEKFLTTIFDATSLKAFY